MRDYFDLCGLNLGLNQKPADFIYRKYHASNQLDESFFMIGAQLGSWWM